MEAAKADGCHEAQGYLFSKPMPNGEVAAFLAKRRTIASAA
jgi:EAL domain-containing protein (putative c-di-GMP-specific phosphodiesterase class I)